ncbi:DUF3253 domain-containing protein [Acidisoma cellulosilytica]|uniref:DUF3253 domain-containing protein n=1 Tax=Acidisoma cellulosilyticum TaxID=2802395 RepID=A0A963Z2Q1_9PROT|nr:DUF3253 domain-containing protein [Acidisoma cellulosilyticum]MCB8880775.1 DUF3253 domain-containing protein [Acidisoma cellulosilyticum]
MDELNGQVEATETAADAGAEKKLNSYEAAILLMVAKTEGGKSITPADVAMSLSENWRPVLHHVRAAARRLAEQGLIEILRHGKPVEPAAMKGVIRLRLKQSS